MLPILYHDEWLIAIDKPAGVLVHRGRESTDRQVVLQALRNQIGQRVFPVHRLDRATSGVLLFALHADAAAQMGSLFRQRVIDKKYLAIVRGYTAEQGIIDHPIQSQDKQSQAAKSRYSRLNCIECDIPAGKYARARYSLVQLNPVSGRRHQLRKHCHHISHPIVGDTIYGDGVHNRIFREHFQVRRLLLHSWSMAFQHPFTQSVISIQCPPDQEWQALLSRFGWGLPDSGC